jgi:hypothetical protein
VAREIMQLLRHQDFRTWLPQRDEGPLVVALPDDTVGDTFRRLGGTRCGAIVVMDGHGLALITSCPASGSGWSVSDPHDLPIHEASEMGMLVSLLRGSRQPVRFRICGDVELELFSAKDDDTEPIPL